MIFDDIRSFLKACEDHDDLETVEGADWDLELGTISELSAEKYGPALLFDKIKGYPAGYRLVANWATSLKRAALLLGVPGAKSPVDIVEVWHARIKQGFKPVPPVEVKTGRFWPQPVESST